MKTGLISPNCFGLLSVSLSESPLTILLNISETAISDLFQKSHIYQVIYDSLNPQRGILRLMYDRILFDCSGPCFAICYRKMRQMS